MSSKNLVLATKSTEHQTLKGLINCIIDGKEVRRAEIDGVQYVNAKDVCTLLGYENPRDAVKNHCVMQGVAKIDGLADDGKTREMTYIDKGNFLRLVTSSKKPEAVKFSDRIFNEVLPDIIKNGYVVDGNEQIRDMAAKIMDRNTPAGELMLILGTVLIERGKDLEELEFQRKQVALASVEMKYLEYDRQNMQDKYFETLDELAKFVNAHGYFTIPETAKNLKLKPTLFRRMLQSQKLISERHKYKYYPNEGSIEEGYLVALSYRDVKGVRRMDTYVTPKGLAFFQENRSVMSRMISEKKYLDHVELVKFDPYSIVSNNLFE